VGKFPASTLYAKNALEIRNNSFSRSFRSPNRHITTENEQLCRTIHNVSYNFFKNITHSLKSATELSESPLPVSETNDPRDFCSRLETHLFSRSFRRLSAVRRGLCHFNWLAPLSDSVIAACGYLLAHLITQLLSVSWNYTDFVTCFSMFKVGGHRFGWSEAQGIINDIRVRFQELFQKRCTAMRA